MAPYTPLVPVTLKEAALDSPTFRGTVIHYAEQVENVEKWLDGYLKAATRLCNEVHALEDTVNNFIQRSTPTNVFESILDCDYTHLALRRSAEGSKDHWSQVIGSAKKFEQTVIEPLLSLQRGELKNFKEIRRQLDSAQSRYDTLLSRYAAQSKSKEPSALREDAFQLYEARKLYFKICFDFCISAPSLRSSLDRTITRVLTDNWRDRKNVGRLGSAILDKYNAEMESIRAWSDNMEASENVLKNELITTRRDIEETVKQETYPARELEEYAVSTVAYLSSNSAGVRAGVISRTEKSEKQGWLFVRSFTAKPTRAIWVRRWFFIKNGIFGYLMQGYRGGGVEESEKIGVLLCNVRPAFQEERRFCYEVKTKDTAILLQAETQSDLTSWIEIFEQAKRKAVESSSSTADQAFAIIPPSAPAPELSVKDHLHHDENISMGFDRSLTLPLSGVQPPDGLRGTVLARISDQNKGKNADNQRALSPGAASNPSTGAIGFGALISATHGAFPMDFRTQQGNSPVSPASPYGASAGDISITQSQLALLPSTPKNSLAPTTLAHTPAPGSLAKAAAITAFSSQVNSSDLRMGARSQGGHKKTQSLDINTSSGGLQKGNTGALFYPPNYPGQLRAQDIHFRSLFPGEAMGQPILLVFRASWNLNDRKEFSGRCYITAENIYFYSHHLGFVYKRILPLDTIEEVTASPGKDCDHLFFHLRPGDPDDSDYEDEAQDVNALKVAVKVYLEPVRLLQRRLHLLVKQAESNANESNFKDILDKLIALETEPEPTTAPDSESWEEITAEGLDMSTYREGVGRDAPRHTESFEIIKKKQAPKMKEPRFKHPKGPIVYEPTGMHKKAFEREFDVPPKALFHLMFGRKSAIFRTLYNERNAKNVQQGPWVRPENGTIKREFTYEVEQRDIRRRTRSSKVLDCQTIDVADDHVCYVVTDRKTPWHLPHRDHFLLVSKMVISYVARSKCKLAIWTAVQWSKAPALSKGIVQRQALDDLDTDALDLGDVVADQIRRLGTESRTKKAIAIFGQIVEGSPEPEENTTDVKADTANAKEHVPRPPRDPQRSRIKQHSLANMMVEDLVSLGQSMLSNILMGAFAALRKGYEIISAQRIILLLLGCSIFGNMLLTSRSTVSFWTERRAARFMDQIGVKPKLIMSKAIYLKDIEEVVKNGTELAVIPSSKCYTKFRDLATEDHSDSLNSSWETSFTGRSTRTTAHKLMRIRLSLGTYRHDLLVALRLINNIERQAIHSEWENWLLEENIRCRQASYMLRDMKQKISRRERESENMPSSSAQRSSVTQSLPREVDDDDVQSLVEQEECEELAQEEHMVENVAKWISEYCSSCDAERQELFAEGKRLSFV